MSFKIGKKSGNITVIDCPRRLDVNISDDLKKIMTQLIEEKKFKIIINLTGTKYVDSSGLGAIVSRIAVTLECYDDVKTALESF
jgi:anti-sigma B factor antagonist